MRTDGERLTLCLRAGVGGDTAFRYHVKGRERRILLVGRGLGYAIAAKADRNLLLRIAELVYQQTTQEGAKAQILPAPGKPS